MEQEQIPWRQSCPSIIFFLYSILGSIFSIFSMLYNRKYRTLEGSWPISNPSSISRDARLIEIFENFEDFDGILSILKEGFKIENIEKIGD